jgi:DNA-binding MarR family transcriptional regulator
MPRPSPELDEAFLSRARLGIVAALLVRPEASFADLKALLSLTQGNLGSHLRRLEADGFVAVHKEFVDRTPRTTVRLTPEGRRAFRAHVAALERLARDGVRPAAPPRVRSGASA